jgi:hypothetical protein
MTEKDNFYSLLKELKGKAVRTELNYTQFYDELTIETLDGKYLYVEDADKGIPYSIERIA